jgi:hypothetical protein
MRDKKDALSKRVMQEEREEEGGMKEGGMEEGRIEEGGWSEE